MASDKNLLDKLPYELTKGVTATEDGLLVFKSAGKCIGVAVRHGRNVLVPWGWAAERLRYREGEPWCQAFGYAIITGNATQLHPRIEHYTLHRLAAILCDDAEAFRILHTCIEEFGNGE